MTASPGPLPIRAVVFDLDGTLVQTRIASWEVFSRVNERFGLGIDSPEQYFDLFRGNIFAEIRRLCRDDSQADEVSQAFLQLLRDEYMPALVPGVAAVVRRLAAECTLAVMSSNAMQVLRRILVDNDLAFCFAHVFGGDISADKRTALRTFLADAGSGFGRRCSADYDEAGRCHALDPASTVLVTDTAGDVRDAREVGVRVVGVAWGMHGVEELLEAGAEFVALWPQEITAHILGDVAARPVEGACAVPLAPAVPPVPAGPRMPPAAETRRAGQGPCDCGGTCAGPPTDEVRAAGAIRRERRRRTAAPTAAGGRPAATPARHPAALDELLEAVRLLVGRG
jgi:phosphoglycolate phosphatase